MTKFKVGDIVVGNQDSEENGVEQGQLYQVLAAERVYGYDYIKTDLSSGCWVLSERFDLYKAAPYQEEQDDPLPPAPESVRYYNSFIMGNNDQNLTVGPATEYPGEGLLSLLITPNSHSTRNAAPLSINMDADAALQLAHDLNRMANEIKRRERAQSGE